MVKVPAPEESQEDQESGSEASDSVSNSGQPGSGQNGQNVTLITLNSEGTLSRLPLTWKRKIFFTWYLLVCVCGKQSLHIECRTKFWRVMTHILMVCF